MFHVGENKKICSSCGSSHERSHRYCLNCHAKYMRQWRKTHPLTKEQRFKSNARSYANTYKKRGKLSEEACAICGSAAQMHHNDYGRPLEVVWLCREHHLKLAHGI